MVFAVVVNVAKEELLIAEFVVMFKVIECMFEDAVIYAVLVLVAFVGLLPA